MIPEEDYAIMGDLVKIGLIVIWMIGVAVAGIAIGWFLADVNW